MAHSATTRFPARLIVWLAAILLVLSAQLSPTIGDDAPAKDATAPADAAEDTATPGESTEDAVAPGAAPGTWQAASTAPDKPSDYELYKPLVDTLDQVERNYVHELDRRELFEAAIEGVVSKLDPYSAYISPADIRGFRRTVESEFGGIGIQVSIDRGRLMVISPLVGTPAYQAGIQADDWITAIDGESTKGFTLDDAVKRLKGKIGTKVKLTVVHPASKKREQIAVTRERIHIDTVLGDHRNEHDAWDYTLDDRKGIGYIRVTAFSRDTAEELRDALEQLKTDNVRGLILDLRFNPGGLLSAAIEVADLFIKQGEIVSTEGRNSARRSWDAREAGTFDALPMVVLVNRYSASASEIVSACLQDHGRAVIMGERTWGKGSVQNVIELEAGTSALKLTTAAYRRPSGKNIHRFDNAGPQDDRGVKPDDGYYVELTDDEISQLMDFRRQRDIVRARTAETAEAQPESSPKSEAKPAAEQHASPLKIDRQLKMAVGYLDAQFAKAQP